MNEEEFTQAQYGRTLDVQAADASIKSAQHQILIQDQEKGLAEAQLDVEEIIERIHNLLEGKEFKDLGNGVRGWVESNNNDNKTLSEWGVHRIMQTVRFHINKNTLLSNFSAEQIDRLMLSFMTEMNDLVLLKYEKLFREATFEECKQILEDRLKDRRNLKKFALEILGENPDDEKINKQVMKEMEGLIEKEIQEIKEQQRRERIKEYGLLLEEIESQVFATYNRAWKGEERGSLRRHATFSDVRTTGMAQPQKKGGVFGWIKG